MTAQMVVTVANQDVPELTAKMAIKMGSKCKFIEVMGQCCDQFAVGAGLSKPQRRRRVLELAKPLPAAARRLHRRADSSTFR